MRTFKDDIHGITASAKSKTGAWMLIRNECHNRGIKVPQMNQITEIKLKK